MDRARDSLEHTRTQPAPHRPRAVLPFEPRVPDEQAQQALTERFLLPYISDLEALFLAMRRNIDPALRRAQPYKIGKPYPIGQCLEIVQALQNHLGRIDRSLYAGAASSGLVALEAFLREGGAARLAWGDLRGQYFQNAFLIGTLYVDAANDTVVSTKPPVEILPLSRAGFRPIEDYGHFSRIAARYWKARVFPNHILPSLAPYFPLIVASPGETVRLEMSGYMSVLTVAEAFRPSETLLASSLMNEGLFEMAASCLAGSVHGMAADPVKGQTEALHLCRHYRTQMCHLQAEKRIAAAHAAEVVNERLKALVVTGKPERPSRT